MSKYCIHCAVLQANTTGNYGQWKSCSWVSVGKGTKASSGNTGLNWLYVASSLLFGAHLFTIFMYLVSPLSCNLFLKTVRSWKEQNVSSSVILLGRGHGHESTWVCQLLSNYLHCQILYKLVESRHMLWYRLFGSFICTRYTKKLRSMTHHFVYL